MCLPLGTQGCDAEWTLAVVGMGGYKQPGSSAAGMDGETVTVRGKKVTNWRILVVLAILLRLFVASLFL